jgi:uncharacterized membrane protein
VETGRRTRHEHEIEFSRIVAFSDGVFAIAITLLVLQIEVPQGIGSHGDLADALLDQSGDLFAYAISFAVIGRFWYSHHRFFGEIRGFNAWLIALNLTYLGCMVLIPFSSEVLGEYGDRSAAVVLYAANLAIVTLLAAALTTYAVRAGLTTPGLDEEIGAGRDGTLYAAGVFVASIPVALVAPGVAPFTWLALFLDPTGRIRARRARR